MSEFPGRPRLTKGALLVFGSVAPVPVQLIVFPLNPDSLARRFDLGQAVGAKPPAGAGESQTPATTPVETLTVSLALDAADQLEHPAANPVTVVSGLLPVISAIEQLIHPSTVLAKLTKLQAEIGLAVITPQGLNWTVLVWGAGRVLPVKVAGLSVTEQAFDARLNPISARAELQLTTLSQDELKAAPVFISALADVHAVAREVFSAVNTAQSAAQAPSVLPL
ncbi:hypothetical protein BX285_4495 [Streptomyces sp. 1114.5]|uniref:hypothetical protein n=1 Tax=unclassified Streptomyces TaxID=2593676 RepID=UPI000BD9EE78|nr:MULTISPECIES: hypothetical protein [unclassified Streptomyces]RKT20017.1 hypothetical protein BX285_4495 [Streptomyces sp. 1114.5]SOB86209.1 hypothetical protein SAMN06272789_6517 [Streptomyces sp. 1331.2]